MRVSRLAVGFGLLLAAASAGPGRAADPIKVGEIAPRSGPLAWYGQELGRGFELAVAKVNADGGVLGRKVELVIADAPTATAAIGEMERLRGGGARVVGGSAFSAVSLSASAAAERNGMFYWEVLALDNAITTRGLKHTFQFAPDNDAFTAVSIGLLQDVSPPTLGKPLTQTTAGLVYENSVYGMTQSKTQREKLAGLGVKVVVDQSYSRATSDLSPVVLQLKAASPDVVIQTGYQDDIVLMWRQAKELGYLPKLLISSGAAATTDFRDALGPKGVDGFMAYNFPLYDAPEKGAPGAAAFGRAYVAAYHEPPRSGHALGAYSGMLALIDVIRAAGSDDPDAVAAAARQADRPMGSYPNGAGLKFNPNGRNLLAPVDGFQWQDGRLFTIWPSQAANGKPQGPLVPWDKR